MRDSLDAFLDQYDPNAVMAKIRQAADKYGLDPAIALGLAESESNFNQAATSKTGARGVFQFTRGTAKELGIDREDLDQNIEGGVRYLSQLLARHGGDVAKAFRDYKGVEAGGATDADVERAVSLVDRHRSGNGNENEKRTPFPANGNGATHQPDELDLFLDRYAAVPSREELERKAAEIDQRRSNIEALAADLDKRRLELQHAPVELGRLSALLGRRGPKVVEPLVLDYHRRVGSLEADRAELEAEAEELDRALHELETGRRLYQQNLRRYAESPIPGTERLGGQVPGVPLAGAPIEPVSLDLLNTKPEQAMFRPEQPLLPGKAGKVVEEFLGSFAQGAMSLGTGLGQFIASQSEDSPAMRTLGNALAATGETLEHFFYQPQGEAETWAPEWWARVTGSAMGSMAGFAGTAAGTGKIIDRLTRLAGITGRAARAAKNLGMLTTGSALETISQAGMDAAEAASRGKSPQEAAEIARKSALLSAGPTVLFNALGLYDPRQASIVKRLLWDAAMEVAQENSQQIASNYASGRPLTEGLLESTIGAGAAALIGEPILSHARGGQAAEQSRRRDTQREEPLGLLPAGAGTQGSAETPWPSTRRRSLKSPDAKGGFAAGASRTPWASIAPRPPASSPS
jgi:hypothetical protein